MPSAGLAGWDQAGQQHRRAQPHMATMCMGIRAAVKDMSPVQHVPLGSDNAMAHLSRVLDCLAFWSVPRSGLSRALERATDQTPARFASPRR